MVAEFFEFNVDDFAHRISEPPGSDEFVEQMKVMLTKEILINLRLPSMVHIKRGFSLGESEGLKMDMQRLNLTCKDIYKYLSVHVSTVEEFLAEADPTFINEMVLLAQADPTFINEHKKLSCWGWFVESLHQVAAAADGRENLKKFQIFVCGSSIIPIQGDRFFPNFLTHGLHQLPHS